MENYQKQIAEKANFSIENRKTLVEVLKKQYQKLIDPKISTENSIRNIEKLADKNTFTITTGHQLNLFTGPLYFLYKIISVLNLCKKLKSEYPNYEFVPIFWMASEDHDFEEINFINWGGGRLRWERRSGGPVGRFSTDGIKKIIDELEDLLGAGKNSAEWISLLRKCYLEHETLADATRYLVHHLFGNEGLVILDGDDSELKRLANPYFEKDLFENIPHQKIKETTTKLQELYFEQVHPREINLFYIKNGLRERIERNGEKWQVLNTGISFAENELRNELKNHPERFSPNAILRPLYQEVILPNLAYIGGGGELAYWFQLKGMFDEMEVPFPMLVLRNSALWVEKKWQQKLDDLKLEIKDLFQPLHKIKKEWVKKNAPIDTELSPYEKNLETMFDELEEVAHLTDESMLGAVNAQRQKQLNGLQNLRKKLIRAEKRRHDEKMDKIDRVYYALFPNGSLQERHENLGFFYEKYGEDFIQILMEKLNPMDFRFCVVFSN